MKWLLMMAQHGNSKINKILKIMYKVLVIDKETAFLHLMLHTAHRDGVLTDSELQNLGSAAFYLLKRKVSLIESIVIYRSYSDEIIDEIEYVGYLLSKFNGNENFGLLAFLIDLCVSDGMSLAEESFIDVIAGACGCDAVLLNSLKFTAYSKFNFALELNSDII